MATMPDAPDQPLPEKRHLYIVLISIHGLIRSHSLELGRDADTGGQTKYVVDLARALAEHPSVDRVDLLTRRVEDPKVSADYAQPLDPITDKAFIVRVPCGPRRYLRKEALWPYLDSFADNALQHIRRVGRLPDLIHGHYADAGYAGSVLASLVGVPLAFTGHSLGRVKHQRLQERGMSRITIETRYNISSRVEAEEIALDNAAFVVASTRQEVDEQYAVYERYQPKRMEVIPPGVDLHHFHPPKRFSPHPAIKADVDRFLGDPNKPIVLALSRADERKNIATLVRAYGENQSLRGMSNLVVVAGNREDIGTMDKGTRAVLTQLLLLVDRYDLYGSVALPKHHEPADVPELFRMAARSGGIFINPALTEPFGLTLIEAAASGLPVVATEDGGPRDILRYCENGVLIDPLDADRMGQVLVEALSDRARWRQWARNGIRGAHRHFSWAGHVDKYLKVVCRVSHGRKHAPTLARTRSRMITADRLIMCDVDDTLLGDEESLHRLLRDLKNAGGQVGVGIATGRRLDSALKVLRKAGVPATDVMITGVGTEIHYGSRVAEDSGWRKHISYRWEPAALREAMADLPGLRLQPKEEQLRHKISYFIDPDKAPSVREITRHLRRLNLQAKVIYSHHAYIDLVPIRASKGLALRYLSNKWGLPLERFLVAGDSGNDEEMLYGNTLGVVVGNHDPELDHLRGWPRIYFAQGSHAAGIIEGIAHYNFLGEIRVNDEEEEPETEEQ